MENEKPRIKVVEKSYYFVENSVFFCYKDLQGIEYVEEYELRDNRKLGLETTYEKKVRYNLLTITKAEAEEVEVEDETEEADTCGIADLEGKNDVCEALTDIIPLTPLIPKLEVDVSEQMAKDFEADALRERIGI